MVRQNRFKNGRTIAEALRWSREYLSHLEVPEPYMEGEYLLTHVLGCQRKDLLIHPGRVLTSDEMKRFSEVIERRGRREPPQYILGEVEFRGLLFKVNREVLIPRPETELLVEEAVNSVCSGDTILNLQEIKYGVPGIKDVTVLDLCTGSGCIAICIAKELKETIPLFPPLLKGERGGLKVYAVDISGRAIAIARKNAERHRVEEKITFLVGDLFNAIEPLGLEGKIDLIVSNPPYVSKEAMERLQPEIKGYEPVLALYGGEDGLDFYRRIIREAPRYLKQQGGLILEIGFNQARHVRNLFEKEKVFSGIEVKRDLAGIERVIKASYLS
ncbi:MAG: peptide chain release factor N(5)-glutamine methyltransferase [Nitrospirae bacterium]|nr:peptide chain release factor N(5)-glutamine methyltransferase [Nitrospirota bacterium]